MAELKETITTSQYIKWDTAIAELPKSTLGIASNAHLVESAIKAGMIEGAGSVDDLSYADIVELANALTERVKDWIGTAKKKTS